jgi:Mrp family chromosome partitioning ATPase
VSDIPKKILVLSGKGGVGKSTVAVNLARALARRNRQVGLLDVDFHGPSVPQLLNLDGRHAAAQDGKMLPVEAAGIKVISVAFLLADRDDPVIWRGPMKANVIRQFLEQVAWGPIDVLVVDCPPGTGDEPLSVVQLLEGGAGAVVVTTPQAVAIQDVRKCIAFCRRLEVPVLGVIENMSGFVCPACGETTDIFRRGGGERMARDMGVPFLGAIPLDPRLVLAGDAGDAFFVRYPDSAAAAALDAAVEPLLAL